MYDVFHIFIIYKFLYSIFLGLASELTLLINQHSMSCATGLIILIIYLFVGYFPYRIKVPDQSHHQGIIYNYSTHYNNIFSLLYNSFKYNYVNNQLEIMLNNFNSRISILYHERSGNTLNQMQVSKKFVLSPRSKVLGIHFLCLLLHQTTGLIGYRIYINISHNNKRNSEITYNLEFKFESKLTGFLWHFSASQIAKNTVHYHMVFLPLSLSYHFSLSLDWTLKNFF